jgi:hypothetical protein
MILRAKSDNDAARCIRPSYQLPAGWAIPFYVLFVEEYPVVGRILALLNAVIIPNPTPATNFYLSVTYW